MNTEIFCQSAKSSQQIRDEAQLSEILDSAFENGEAVEGEFPFMVSLGYRDKKKSNNVNYKCGGSLITTLYILTAAHCVNANNQLPVEVRKLTILHKYLFLFKSQKLSMLLLENN